MSTNRFPQFSKVVPSNALTISEVVRVLPFEIQFEGTVFAVLTRVGEHYVFVSTDHENVVQLNGVATEAVVVSDGDRIQFHGNEWVFELGDGQGCPQLCPTESELVGETSLLVHHRINNFFQVINGGGFLVETGIGNQDFDLVSRGWSTVKSKQEQLAELLSKVVSLHNPPVLSRENGNLIELLENVGKRWSEKAARNGIEIEFEQTGQTVYCGFDRLQLGEAVNGLLDVAAKASFHDKRGIGIEVTANKHFIQVEICYLGTGISITPENSQNIRRQANETSGGVEFNLSRSLVRAHGGDIVLTHAAADQRQVNAYLPFGTLEST